MALRKAQGQRGKYLTRELSSTRNPVEDMCAIVSKFQSAKIGDGYTPTTTLLEHTLLTQGFTGVQKAAFTCRLRPQNRDSTWVDLVNTLK